MFPSDPLGPGVLGRRVVVRRRLGVEQGRMRYGDVLGLLERWADDRLDVRRSDGSRVEIAVADVVAGKTVPPPPARSRHAVDPPPDSDERLAAVSATGWPAPVTERLGDWWLRAAGGFTNRANSALVVGDPGVGWLAAAAAVREFYRRHALTPLAQLVIGSLRDRTAAEQGWEVDRSGVAPAHHPAVLVQTMPLGRLLAAAGDAGPVADAGDAGPVADAGDAGRAVGSPRDVPPVRVDPTVSADWLHRYGRGFDSSARAVLEGPERVGFASLGHPAVAVGRGVVTGRWLGLAAVTVDAEHRRRGLARTVVAALARWGREQGADWAYLQVGSDNIPARELYAGLGFRTDHAYHYRTPPSER